jgi:hypothetical protein
MDVLKAQGCVLCRGDKSEFVLILPWGQHKALSSMIYGRPAKAVLRRAMSDIGITKLPTVPESKAMVKAKLSKAKTRQAIRAYTGRRLSRIATATKSVTKSQATTPVQKLAQPVLGHAAMDTKRQEQSQLVPVRPASSKAGWPEAAITAWETWGRHNPTWFFRGWSELAGLNFVPK